MLEDQVVGCRANGVLRYSLGADQGLSLALPLCRAAVRGRWEEDAEAWDRVWECSRIRVQGVGWMGWG